MTCMKFRINTVLVADDFSGFRQLLQQKLHENGFPDTVEAVDGLEVVTKAAELQPDLVLLDIAMPKLNGIEAAARIRTVAPKSKILFVSQNADSDVAQSVLRDGGSGYVCKSEIHHELLTAIEAVLGGGSFISSGLHPT
jgi:Response regulator containing a CheY-like receiver domain and an HTH DNA-binding domain